MKKLILSISLFMFLGIVLIQGQYHSEISAPNDRVLQLESPSGAFGSGPILNWKSEFNSFLYSANASLVPNDVNFPYRTNSLEFLGPDNGRINFFPEPEHHGIRHHNKIVSIF